MNSKDPFVSTHSLSHLLEGLQKRSRPDFCVTDGSQAKIFMLVRQES